MKLRRIEEHYAEGKHRVTSLQRHYQHPETGLWHRSVTGIADCYMKPAVLAWSVNNFNTEAERQSALEKAGDRGTKVHEALDFGGTIPYTSEHEETYPYLSGAKNFYETFDPEVLRREYQVYGENDLVRYAGTVDLLLRIDRGLLEEHLKNRRKKIRQEWRTGEIGTYIADYKTSGDIYRGHELQLCGYYYAAPLAPYDEEIDGCLILRLGTGSKAGWYAYLTSPASDLPVFEACCTIHKDYYPDDDPPSWLVDAEIDFTRWLPRKP